MGKARKKKKRRGEKVTRDGFAGHKLRKVTTKMRVPGPRQWG